MCWLLLVLSLLTLLAGLGTLYSFDSLFFMGQTFFLVSIMLNVVADIWYLTKIHSNYPEITFHSSTNQRGFFHSFFLARYL